MRSMKIRLIDRMIHHYGAGPEGKTCGECRLFYEISFASGRSAGKCNLYLAFPGRRDRGGKAADWRKSWPACRMWEGM